MVVSCAGARVAATALKLANPNMAAVIGPSCDDGVKEVATAGLNLTVMAPGSASVQSLAETASSNVVHLQISDAERASGMAKLCNQYGWNQIAILHDDSASYTQAAASFLTSLQALQSNTTVVLNPTNQSFSYADFVNANVTSLVEQVHASRARVTYLSVSKDILRDFFSAVYTTGMQYGSGFAFIVDGGLDAS
eukprot:3687510-Prymnesium_polylepis.1